MRKRRRVYKSGGGCNLAGDNAAIIATGGQTRTMMVCWQIR